VDDREIGWIMAKGDVVSLLDGYMTRDRSDLARRKPHMFLFLDSGSVAENKRPRQGGHYYPFREDHLDN